MTFDKFEITTQLVQKKLRKFTKFTNETNHKKGKIKNKLEEVLKKSRTVFRLKKR